MHARGASWLCETVSTKRQPQQYMWCRLQGAEPEKHSLAFCTMVGSGGASVIVDLVSPGKNLGAYEDLQRNSTTPEDPRSRHKGASEENDHASKQTKLKLQKELKS